MSFFSNCYKKENLDSIINTAVEKVAPNIGIPEKIISVPVGGINLVHT